MRKLIVSMNISLDGYMSGINRELDWHFSYWNEAMAEELCVQLADSDTLLLGRTTYEAMAEYWPARTREQVYPGQQQDFCYMMHNHLKVVFSNSLETVDWHNSRVIGGNLMAETSKLKLLAGKDIIVYGSGTLVAALMPTGLIDEYRLWMHPVVLQQGKPFFRGFAHCSRFSLQGSRTFQSGVILLRYRPCEVRSGGFLPSI